MQRRQCCRARAIPARPESPIIKTLRALIDSGATQTGIFRSAVRRIGLHYDDFAVEHRHGVEGIGPRRRMAVTQVMEPITIGDIKIANLPVDIVDQSSVKGVDMILGLDFLTRVHVWLSFSSRTLVMQYPSLPSPPIEP